MKSLLCLFLPALLIVACGAPSDQTVRTPQRYSLDQFYKNTNTTGGTFSPDGSKLLVSSNKTGIYNAFALPVDGSEPVQLTHSTAQSIFTISYFPADERFLYSSDEGGNEITHIYLRDLDGNVRDLTPGENAKSEFTGWSKDLGSFFYTSNVRTPEFFDLYEMPIATFEPVLVYQNTEGHNVAAISENKRYLALVKSITTNNNDVYLYDLETKTSTHITPHTGDASYQPQYFDKDNTALYYLSNEEGEYMVLRKYDIASGKHENVYSADWDIWYAYESFNNTYRVIGINADGRTDVKLFDLGTGAQRAFPDIDGRSITSVSISRDEKHMRLTAASSKFPSDIYVYHFADGSHRRLTNNLNPEINPEDLVEGIVVRYKSFDGVEIPAIYYKPLNASKDQPCPAVVWVHGGPGGQTRLSYFPLIQAMVNHGYAVLGVNNRGSSGYGKTFFKMDDQKHGDEDLKDCIYGKRYLQTLDYIDKEKIGIAGGSYGGYMVMAALAFAPEEFAVGVNIFGVTNWLRTLKSIPPWWESFRAALYAELGDPNTADSVRLYNISPLFHAKNVTKPLIVLQGANDPRVLQVESDEIVAAVKANNVHVEYILFDDEGHGFVKKENEIEGYGKVLEFLDTYLRGEGPVAK